MRCTVEISLALPIGRRNQVGSDSIGDRFAIPEESALLCGADGNESWADGVLTNWSILVDKSIYSDNLYDKNVKAFNSRCCFTQFFALIRQTRLI